MGWRNIPTTTTISKLLYVYMEINSNHHHQKKFARRHSIMYTEYFVNFSSCLRIQIFRVFHFLIKYEGRKAVQFC